MKGRDCIISFIIISLCTIPFFDLTKIESRRLITPSDTNASNSQVISITYIDPENDVAKCNQSSGAILQSGITAPEYDITNVTVTTNLQNYTISLYIKGGFNQTREDYMYTYNMWMYWNWSNVPGGKTQSYGRIYEEFNVPRFYIFDDLLGSKQFDQGARFNNATHRFSCSFNRSWINDSSLGVPINELWVNATIAHFLGYEGSTPVEYRDTLDNGYYSVKVIGLSPQADFIADKTTVALMEAVHFTYTGTTGDGLSSYQWNFGDSALNATIASPTHQYAVPGLYTVTLFVNDTNGDGSVCSKVSYINVTADLLPIADFIANVTYVGINGYIQFSYTGTEGDGIISYQWDFGDGSSNGTSRNPVHKYSIAGRYSVKVTVIDSDGDLSICREANYITVGTQSPFPDYLFWLIPLIGAIILIVGITQGIRRRKKRLSKKR